MAKLPLALLLILAHISTSGLAAQTGSNCGSRYASLIQQPRQILKIEFSPEMKGWRFPIQEVPGYRDDAIYIGIANSEADGAHHYYLMTGNARYDGRPFFAKPDISNGNIASNGLLFEIPVEPHVLRALQKRVRVEANTRSATCLHAICNLLSKEGIVIDQKGARRITRARVVFANLRAGKIRVQGKSQDPATMRLLATGSEEYFSAAKIAGDADKIFKANVAFIAVGISSIPLGGAGIVFAVKAIGSRLRPADAPGESPSPKDGN